MSPKISCSTKVSSFCGIPETKDENCDQIILNAVNKLILVDEKKTNYTGPDRTLTLGWTPAERKPEF